jgi:predicted amidophosphoribosyltransferase
MENQIKKITGNWDAGLVLDKHTRSSIFLGYDERGNTRFETKRSEVGEALFQLKYRGDFNKVEALAKEIATHIAPQFAKIGFIVPMPPSRHRPRQPVTEIAKSLSQTLQVPMFDNILVRVPPNPDQKPAKDLVGKEAKVEAMKDRFGLQQNIANEGKWNVLLVYDLYDTGASMEAATAKLREYKKVGNVYVAALTWK